MKLLIVAALLAAGAGAPWPSPTSNICLSPPVRTTPHGNYERADKWQNDQRTIA